MKKLIPLIIIGIVIISGLGAVALPENEYKTREIREIIHFSEPEIQEKEENIHVTVENTNSWLRIPDYPMLPAYIKTYVTLWNICSENRCHFFKYRKIFSK